MSEFESTIPIIISHLVFIIFVELGKQRITKPIASTVFPRFPRCVIWNFILEIMQLPNVQKQNQGQRDNRSDIE